MDIIYRQAVIKPSAKAQVFLISHVCCSRQTQDSVVLTF